MLLNGEFYSFVINVLGTLIMMKTEHNHNNKIPFLE